MLSTIRIVLIQTSHPGNIGSAARAMKTMGLNSLYLVAPKLFPHDKATEMASSADDVLTQAIVVSTLEEAIADCGLIIGTSARSRAIPWPLLTPREGAARATTESAMHPVAILFGREQTGLTNDELQRCHFHVHIPSNPEYSSLNIAAAVQLISYELRVAHLDHAIPPTLASENADFWDYRLATSAEMEGFYHHLEEMLVSIDFLNREAPRKLIPRLRRLFNRARPDIMEINMLRGIFSAVNKKRK